MKTQSTEQDWLDATQRIIDYAKRQKPPAISRSEVESLIIGLRSLAQSEKGKKVLGMLQGYLDIMKSKKKNWLKIS